MSMAKSRWTTIGRTVSHFLQGYIAKINTLFSQSRRKLTNMLNVDCRSHCKARSFKSNRIVTWPTWLNHHHDPKIRYKIAFLSAVLRNVWKPCPFVASTWYSTSKGNKVERTKKCMYDSLEVQQMKWVIRLRCFFSITNRKSDHHFDLRTKRTVHCLRKRHPKIPVGRANKKGVSRCTKKVKHLSTNKISRQNSF